MAVTWRSQHVIALCCRSGASDKSYMAFRAADRVVGLMSWPLDGDPAKSVGVIAHPGPVLTAALTHDGRKLLSAGVQDGVVNVWQVGSVPGSRPSQLCRMWSKAPHSELLLALWPVAEWLLLLGKQLFSCRSH